MKDRVPTKHAAYLGIEIGGTKLQIVSGDETSDIVDRWRFTVNPAEGGAGIRRQIESALAAHAGVVEKTRGVGVGFGGPVDWQTGRIACSHQIEGWNDFNLKEWLEQRVPAPVAVDNDANVGALGEACRGAGKGGNPVMYVTLGSGVGGGLAVNESIYHGAKPGEVEIGHVRLDRRGATVESRCSGWAVDKKIRRACVQNPEAPLAKAIIGKRGGEARFLARACEQGDPIALRLLAETAEDLAFGLSHATHLFHPEIMVLGGGLSLMGEILRKAVAERLPEFVMQAFAPGPRVCLASLSEDAVPIGALLLARQRAGGPHSAV